MLHCTLLTTAVMAQTGVLEQVAGAVIVIVFDWPDAAEKDSTWLPALIGYGPKAVATLYAPDFPPPVQPPVQ